MDVAMPRGCTPGIDLTTDRRGGMDRKLTQQQFGAISGSLSVSFRVHSLAAGASAAVFVMAKSLLTEKQRACNCIEMVRSVPTRAGWPR